MATKPGVQLPEWASNANYATGPKAGTPTKVALPGAIAQDGHRPGKTAPTAAQHWNDWLNLLSKWVEWVRQGSALGAADPHLVETGANGYFKIQGIEVEPTAAAPWSLSVKSPPGATGTALLAQGGGAFGDPVIQVISSGASPGLAINGAASTGYALSIAGNAAGPAALRVTGNGAIEAVSSGTNPALQATGHATSTDAVLFTTNKADGNVLRVLGAASAAQAAAFIAGDNSNGAYSRGGSVSGTGLVGEALSTSAYGLHGKTAAAGTTSARGVFGEGLGSGVGVYGSSENGHGVRALTSGNQRAPLLLGGHASDPANGNGGGLAFNTADEMIKHYIGAQWCGLMWRRKGSAGEVEDSVGAETSNDNTSPVTIVTRALADYQAPKVTGKVVIRVDARIGRTGACRIGFELVDVTAGGNVQTWDLPLYQSGASVYERETTLSAVYTLPAAGNRTFRLDMYRIGGGGGDLVRCTDVVMTVDGVFEG